MILTNLRTFHMVNPLGVEGTPYFSWMLESDTPNTLQTAYRLSVCDESGAEVWNSGRCESDSTAYIEYAGKPLISRMRYTWSVTAWDNHGNTATAGCLTGLQSRLAADNMCFTAVIKYETRIIAPGAGVK